jgi:hypothetical protein
MWWIPLLLAANAVFLYTLFNGIPEFDALTEETKQEFTGRLNGIAFTLYWMFMGFFSPNPSARLAEFVAYTLYDMGHMMTYSSKVDYYLHHITFLVIYAVVALFLGPAEMSLLTTASYFLESTNPFLSLSWMFTVLKYPMDDIHKSVQAITFVVWTLVRMVFFNYWGYTTLTSAHLPFFVPWFILNCYWFWLLCKKAMKAFTKTSPSPAGESPDPQAAGAGSVRSSPREPRT